MVPTSNCCYRGQDHTWSTHDSHKRYERNTRNIRAPRRSKTLLSAGNSTSTSIFNKLAGVFLGKTNSPTRVGPSRWSCLTKNWVIELSQMSLTVVGRKLGLGRKSPHNFKYRTRLRGYSSESDESDLEHRADEVAQCHALTAAYRTKNGWHIASPENSTFRGVKRPERENGGDWVYSNNTRARSQKLKRFMCCAAAN